jgi:hypothetical protein
MGLTIVEILFGLFLLGCVLLSRWAFKRGWPRRIAVLGYFLPLVIGLCVREFIVMTGGQGASWEWILGWFLSPRSLLFVLAVFYYWDLPFLIVATMAAKLDIGAPRIRALVFGAFFGSLVFTILVFGDLWTDVEHLFFFIDLVPFAVLQGTVLGLGIGWLIGRFMTTPELISRDHAA